MVFTFPWEPFSRLGLTFSSGCVLKGCTSALLEMILLVAAASGSELPGLSDGRPEPVRAGSAGGPELVPSAAGVLAAQGDDAGCSGGGPVHA